MRRRGDRDGVGGVFFHLFRSHCFDFHLGKNQIVNLRKLVMISIALTGWKMVTCENGLIGEYIYIPVILSLQGIKPRARASILSWSDKPNNWVTKDQLAKFQSEVRLD